MNYFIITFGCQMNKSDSERIAALLESSGYKEASKIEEADLIVVNMCSVRQSAVDRVYGLLPKFKKLKEKNQNLKTILTGCILKEDKKKLSKTFDLILNIKDLPCTFLDKKIVKKMHSMLLKKVRGKYLKRKSDAKLRSWLGFGVNNYLSIKPKYQDEFRAFIPISTGCNFSCSYCVIPQTRGKLVCRDHREILKEVEELRSSSPFADAREAEEVVKKGFKEIWLLGQNVNDYSSPANSEINFPKLLKIVSDIPGDFKIRFTSPNPVNFSEELIEVMANSEKIAKYLNLPVQSGDNQILKKMKRPYTIEQYKNLVKKIRKKIPDINLSTDVIVGFPGETKKQFENTVKLFKEIKFNEAYIARYSPRPGTAAFQMKDNVPWEEKKKREKILREIVHSRIKPR